MAYEIRRRTPGHYSSLIAGADNAAMMQSLIVPGSRGYLKRYYWNHLEPSVGVFDFSGVTADLAFCQANNRQLMVMIVDKSFSGPIRTLPKGMEAFEVLNHGGTGTVPGTPTYGGYTSLRWQLPVIVEYNKLTAALGAAFNAHPNFEGVCTVETSTSLDYGTAVKQYKYTPEAYRDSYINILSSAAAAMPNANVFWFQNFFPGNQAYIADIADEVRRVGVSMGGPDALPTNAQLVANVYPVYEQFKGRMALGIQMSNPGYAQLNVQPATTPYMTMDQMLEYIRESLYSDYCFWMPSHAQAGSQSYGWADAVPVIAANPRINF